MLGLLALGLTALMIYTLVKNALLGKQISKDDHFSGAIELILPISENSEFLLAKWQKSLEASRIIHGQLKVHLLMDGNHPQLKDWQEPLRLSPFFVLHNFPMRQPDVEPVTWMLDQVLPKIQGQVVLIGDPELVPTEHLFYSIAKTILEKGRSYFIVPQTAKLNVLGEAIAVLNPTLAFTSFFGFKKWRRNLTHPLLSISQGWFAMDLETFKGLNFRVADNLNWKESISRQWDESKKNYHLAFGEKHLIRYYPEDLRNHSRQLKSKWDALAHSEKKISFALFIVALFLWSFPILCFFTHPFWSIASFFLLILYRFFSKIVFQESWASIILHPIGCLFWIGTLIWYWVSFATDKRSAKLNKE